MNKLLISIELGDGEEENYTEGECPEAIKDQETNIKNHHICIIKAELGPANPKAREEVFWLKKAVLWNVSESAAREMLCSNCEHYWDTKFIKQCMSEYEQITPPMVDPKWVDTKQSGGYCDKFEITCTSSRTCNEWEPGGPMTDENADQESED